MEKYNLNFCQFSNADQSPQPQPHASLTALQPRQQPPPPQPQPLPLVIPKPVPRRMAPAAASPPGSDLLPNIPGPVVSNEPLDLTVKVGVLLSGKPTPQTTLKTVLK